MLSDLKLPNNDTISKMFEEIINALAKTIIGLQSDELINQMKNDQSLYQYKLQRIKQLISEELNFEEIVSQTINENDQLRISKANLQQNLRRYKEEFQTSINDFEQKTMLYQRDKQRQITQLQNEYKDLQMNYKQQLSQLKQKNKQLSKKNMQLEEKSEMFTINLSKKDKFNAEKLQMLQEQIRKQQQTYEDIISKMKEDMHLIKNQWQKKCQESVNQQRIKYKQQLLIHEQNMEKQLQEYIAKLNLGKNVIIREDTELTKNKIQTLKEKFSQELNINKQQNQQLSHINSELQKKLKQIQDRLISKQQEHRKYKLQYQTDKYNYEIQIERLNKDNEKLKAKITQSQHQIRSICLQVDNYRAQIQKNNDENKFYRKKLQTNEEQLQDMKLEITKMHKIKAQQQNEKENLRQQIRKNKDNIMDKQRQLRENSETIQKLKQSIKTQEVAIQQFHEKQQQKIKNQKRRKQKYTNIVNKTDKLRLNLKKLKQQFELKKQMIKGFIQISKTQIVTYGFQFNEALYKFKSQLQGRGKIKMAQLLQQVEENSIKDKEYYENIIIENKKLNQQLKQFEMLFHQKQKEHSLNREKYALQQVQNNKRMIMRDLQKQQVKNERLQNKIRQIKQHYEIIINKLEKDVKLTIINFTDKWHTQIGKHQQEIKNKNKEIQSLQTKMDSIFTQCERIKKIIELEKDQQGRYKKKYEKLKQERDERVQDLLKRLQQENKHKLRLQQQMKDLRKQIAKFLKADPNNLRQNKSSINNINYNSNPLCSDRQKQLTQLRQLVARTYRIADEKPEKDHRASKKKLLL